MRITAGRLRGRRLVDLPGRSIRPSSARLRGAALDLLGDLEGSHGADLFCGAGTVAFEAISRGARLVLLVDRDPSALEIVRRNGGNLGVADRIRVARRDLRRGLPTSVPVHVPWSWVFLDPPYRMLLEPRSRVPLRGLLEALAAPGILAPGGVVLLEHRAGSRLPALRGLRLLETRRYGEGGVSVLRCSPDTDGPG